MRIFLLMKEKNFNVAGSSIYRFSWQFCVRNCQVNIPISITITLKLLEKPKNGRVRFQLMKPHIELVDSMIWKKAIPKM